MSSFQAKKYGAGLPSFIIPQVYDESLSYYENICKLWYAYTSLVSQLNEKYSEELAQELNEYIRDYIYSTVSYTEDDGGLHLNINMAYNSGEHTYNPETQTMTIGTGEE